MKTLLALLLVGLAGCASSASGAAEDTSAADTTPAPPPLPTNLCLMPSDHPFNLAGDVWTVRKGVVTKTRAFYWHGSPMVPETETGASWTITSASTAEIVASNTTGETLTVDLTTVDPDFDFYDATISLSDAAPITGLSGVGCIMTPDATGLPGLGN